MTDDSFHNYYERVVLEHLVDVARGDPTLTDDTLADVACIALNNLPPRYVRFDVDMSFFLSAQDREEITRKTEAAVSYAIDFVRRNMSRQIQL
jgi:predicted 3-demethylubiquinone-9 3-methyltransferase (glyoxalase superfamily)|tara:strand:- start:1086 stop:1364 length:279 start_codon:yes stop_codon:yes gene_type:complete